MSLIDTTYFTGRINIPLNTLNTSTLEAYIERCEKELLLKVLGYDLYTLIAAYDPDTSEQRIIDIVEGKEYAATTDHKVKWDGLANAEKISPLAYFTYYHFVKDHNSLLMPVGNVKPKQENSAAADVSPKLAEAWYYMRQSIGFPGQYILTPSLYNFLMKHLSDYPEWEFTDVGHLNLFGL